MAKKKIAKEEDAIEPGTEVDAIEPTSSESSTDAADAPTRPTDIDVVFSLDTTGSMSPCLTRARRVIAAACKRLFQQVSNIRIGILVHGDYCDHRRSYVTKYHPLTRDIDGIVKFVETVGSTGGGDGDECYEEVLHQAQEFDWRPDCKRALAMVGDCSPHPANESKRQQEGYGFRSPGIALKWEEELDKLVAMNVQVYGVQAMSYSSKRFYQELAHRSGGHYLNLDQFESLTDILMAICYQQAGPEQLTAWEEEVSSSGRMSRAVDKVFATLLGRTETRYAPPKIDTASIGSYQTMVVDRDCCIRDFVEENDLTFKPGMGFYQVTKSEIVQERKEVMVEDLTTGDKWEGNKARELLGLPAAGTRTAGKVKMKVPAGCIAFIQSTSYNRKLIGGTKFLYKVDSSR